MCMDRVVLVACALTVGNPGTAAAGDLTGDRGYLFGGIGAARDHVDCSGTTQCDGRALALEAGGGLWLSPRLAGGRLAVEARLVDFGSAELRSPSIAARFRVDSQLLGLAWHRALGPSLSVTVGAGVARVETRLAATPTGGLTALGDDARTTGYGPVGLRYAIGPGASYGLQWLQTRAQFRRDGLDFGRGRTTALTLNVAQQF